LIFYFLFIRYNRKMSASQLYASSSELVPGAAGSSDNNTLVKGSQVALVLLGAYRLASLAPAAGGQPLQPATTTLLFNCPGAVATDLVYVSKESSTTPASAVVGWALATPGTAGAQYTITLSAAEAFVAHIAVYRVV
jgi:hypothetical protein